MFILTFAGLGLPPVVALLALAVLYGAADRAIGAGVKSARWVAPLILVVAGFALAGLTASLFGLLWAIYRTIPFSAGASAPQTVEERWHALERHIAVAPAAVVLALLRGLPWAPAALAFSLYVPAAVGLALWYGARTAAHAAKGELGGSENVAVEILRGAFFGAAVAVSVLFQA